MTDRFVRENYGDTRFFYDSSFKRYNRAHDYGDTLIFNYNTNYYCGGMPMMNSFYGCGYGADMGSFGQGFGYGLGRVAAPIIYGWLCNKLWGNHDNKQEETKGRGRAASRSPFLFHALDLFLTVFLSCDQSAGFFRKMLFCVCNYIIVEMIIDSDYSHFPFFFLLM